MDENSYQETLRYLAQQSQNELANSYYDQGCALANQRNWAQAIARLTEALSVSPDLPGAADAHAKMGACYEGLNLSDLALAEYTNAIALSPTAANRLARGRLLHHRLRDKQQAIPDYVEVVLLQPNNWEVLGCLGECQIAAGELDAALGNLNQTLRLKPDSAPAYFFRSFIWMKRGDLEQAMLDVNEAIRFDPKLAVSYIRRCEIEMMLGKADEAMADINEAIRLDPKIPFAYAFRGRLQIIAKRYAEAIADLETLAQSQKLTDENVYDIAVCCYYLGQVKRAVSLMTDLLARSASAVENPQVWILQSKCRLRLGENGKALRRPRQGSSVAEAVRR